MMVGEMDFGDIFHEGDDFETQVVYELLTYCTFLVFLCMVTIVIMNLLVSARRDVIARMPVGSSVHMYSCMFLRCRLV